MWSCTDVGEMIHCVYKHIHTHTVILKLLSQTDFELTPQVSKYTKYVT